MAARLAETGVAVEVRAVAHVDRHGHPPGRDQLHTPIVAERLITLFADQATRSPEVKRLRMRLTVIKA